jgi:uncharacterized protein (DUF58 family)
MDRFEIQSIQTTQVKTPTLNRVQEKIRIKLTPYGWVLVFLLVWLPISAIGTANNFLIVMFSLAIGFAAVSHVMARKNLRNVRAVRRFPEEVFAESHFPVEYILTVQSETHPALLTIRENDPLICGSEGVTIPELKHDEKQTCRLVCSTPNRGNIRIGAATVKSSFPFGLAWYSKTICEACDVLVFPKIQPVHDEMPHWYGGMGKGVERINLFGTVPFLLRDYVPGDSYKHIEWKKTARTGKLITKVPAEEDALEIIVRLSRNASEQALSKAASLIVHFSRTRAPLRLQGPGLNLGPGMGKQFVRELLTVLALWDANMERNSVCQETDGILVEVGESGNLTWSRYGEEHAVLAR